MMPARRHRTGLHLALLAHLACSWVSSTALACPDCLAGRVARGSVFGADFTSNLASIASPLVVLSAIVALLHRIDLVPRRRPPESAPKDRTS